MNQQTVLHNDISENMVTPTRWGYAALGFVMSVFLGLVYAWSIFVPPLELEFGWSRSETSMIFTICMFCFCLGGLSAGLSSRRISPRLLVIACALFIGSGFILASGCANLLELYIFYGVCIGFGVGIGYNVIIASMLKWFPDRIGFVGGIMLMGFGMGGMLLGTACAKILALYGWRNTFWGIGIFYLIFFILAAFLVKTPSKTRTFPQKIASKKSHLEIGGEFNTKEMLATRSFQLYFIWAICTVSLGFMLIGHGVPLALELGAGVGSAAILAGFISLFNGLGRVGGGLVFDLLGRKVLMRSSCLGMLITSILLFWAIRDQNLSLLSASFILGGASFGASVIVHSSVTNTFFGMQHYPLNFSVLTLYNLFASFAPFVVGMLHNNFASYLALPFALFILASISLALTFVIKKPSKP